MKPLQVDAAARTELLHEAKYFEDARDGLGKLFVAEVKAVFAQIKRNPGAGRPDVFRVVGHLPATAAMRRAAAT